MDLIPELFRLRQRAEVLHVKIQGLTESVAERILIRQETDTLPKSAPQAQEETAMLRLGSLAFLEQNLSDAMDGLHAQSLMLEQAKLTGTPLDDAILTSLRQTFTEMDAAFDSVDALLVSAQTPEEFLDA